MAALEGLPEKDTVDAKSFVTFYGCQREGCRTRLLRVETLTKNHLKAWSKKLQQ